MAKEQIAVAELVLNMILGKTGGTRVDYFPQKPDFPFDAVYEQAFVRVQRQKCHHLICLCMLDRFCGNHAAYDLPRSVMHLCPACLFIRLEIQCGG